MDEQDSHALFREWDLYDRVVHDNWMAHREISAAIRANLEFDGAIDVLDLGSGDGEMAARALTACEVERYVAVDLSESALQRLERRPVVGKPRLFGPRQPPSKMTICRDMAAVVQVMPSDGFDLILASYSLHHFPADRKGPLLDNVVRILRRGGTFVWTDVVCREGEERDDYLRRLTTHIDSRWISFPPADRQAAIEHILSSDFPEQASWMHEQLKRRGLARVEEVFRDDHFGAWVYSRLSRSNKAGVA